MILAVLIALSLSVSELLTKYRSQLFSHLLNGYFFIYMLLHAFFASLAYSLIPLLKTPIANDSLEHSVVAGFGYALVLRTKLMTVTIGKQELAVGPELLYTGLANYVSFHLENCIRTKRDKIRDNILKVVQSQEVFRTALNIKINELIDQQLRRDLEEAKEKIVNSKVMSEIEKTYGLVRLLIDVQPDEKALTSFLQDLDATK